MKILNLVYPDKSNVQFTHQKFPDGQQNIVINSNVFINSVDEGYLENIKKHKILIKSRLNNFKDLELIICAVASLRELGVKEIHLYVPYILGARSDRKFEDGGNRYIKDVLAPIINSLNLNSVTCLDPHSYVLENCINNFKYLTNIDLTRFAISDLCRFTDNFKPKVDDFILISPDAGASHKIYKLAEAIGYKGDIITCSKERDTEGKLTQVNVPLSFEHVGKSLIIIDDICDGGQTFINIAKEAKRQFQDSATKNKIYLIVTHGIFSKDLHELFKYFDGIYCTNSYSDFKYIPDITDPVIGGIPKDFKQLNVF